MNEFAIARGAAGFVRSKPAGVPQNNYNFNNFSTSITPIDEEMPLSSYPVDEEISDTESIKLKTVIDIIDKHLQQSDSDELDYVLTDIKKQLLS